MESNSETELPSYEGIKVVTYEGSKGRGVISTKSWKRGDIVHIAHCIYFPPNEIELILKTELQHYTYKAADGGHLLALNCGSLFNHADNPNLDYRVDLPGRKIRYFAAREIEPDDELCIFYGHFLWFSPCLDSSQASQSVNNLESHDSIVEPEDSPFPFDDSLY